MHGRTRLRAGRNGSSAEALAKVEVEELYACACKERLSATLVA